MLSRKIMPSLIATRQARACQAPGVSASCSGSSFPLSSLQIPQGVKKDGLLPNSITYHCSSMLTWSFDTKPRHSQMMSLLPLVHHHPCFCAWFVLRRGLSEAVLSGTKPSFPSSLSLLYASPSRSAKPLQLAAARADLLPHRWLRRSGTNAKPMQAQ